MDVFPKTISCFYTKEGIFILKLDFVTNDVDRYFKDNLVGQSHGRG